MRADVVALANVGAAFEELWGAGGVVAEDTQAAALNGAEESGTTTAKDAEGAEDAEETEAAGEESEATLKEGSGSEAAGQGARSEAAEEGAGSRATAQEKAWSVAAMEQAEGARSAVAKRLLAAERSLASTSKMMQVVNWESHQVSLLEAKAMRLRAEGAEAQANTLQTIATQKRTFVRSRKREALVQGLCMDTHTPQAARSVEVWRRVAWSASVVHHRKAEDMW